MNVLRLQSVVDSNGENISIGVLDIDAGGAIQNGHLFFNVSVDLGAAACPECKTATRLFFSPMWSILGSVQNITTSGFVNFTNVPAGVTNAYLSNMLGFTLVNPSGFTNLKSSLQFYINGTLVVNNTAIGTLSPHLVTSFDNTTTVGTASLFSVWSGNNSVKSSGLQSYWMLDINNNNITGSWVIWTYFNQITYSQAFEDYYNYAFYIAWEY